MAVNCKFLFFFLLATVFQWITGNSAFSQNRERKISEIIQYKITNWSTDDGLPSNTVVYLFQDANDYLWLGGYDGLSRFDGTRFTVFTKNNTPELESFHSRVLLGDAEDNMWIGTGFGLVKYKDGIFTNLAGEHRDFFIESMLMNADQSIWIGTRNSGLQLYDIKKDSYTSSVNKFSKDLINSIVHDADGGIWIGSEKNGLGHFSSGEWKYYGREDGLSNTEINSLYLNAPGELLIGTTTGMFTFKDNAFTEEKKLEGVRINKITKDHTGNLWVLSATGVYIRSEDGTWKIIDKRNGLSNNDIRDVLFDAEGNVWLATYRGGLNQLKEVKFVTFAEPEGLEVEATGAIQQLDTNKYLVGTTDGKLYAIDNGEVKPYPIKTNLTQRIYSIVKDDKNNLWIASYDGLLLITPKGTEKLFTEKDGLPTRQLRVIKQDRNKNFWIGSRPNGLIRMTFTDPLKPSFSQFQYEKLNELDATFTMSIDEDRDGNLLVSSNTGGLISITPEGSISNFSVKQGLISNVTYNVRADSEGVIWVATSDGLGRIENGTIFNYTRKDGMPHEGVYDLVEDSNGFCWLPSPKGIIRVQKKQLNEYKDGKIKSIEWKLFDKTNDLIKAECTGATRMFKDWDGNLWFMVLGGVVALDPTTLKPNTRAPKIFIESFLIDDTEADIKGNIEIPADNQRITFSYAALSLKYPKGVQYKYKIEDFDKSWIDANTDKQAVYTNLPPGSYTFIVTACNNDGVWNETGTSLSFVVKPYFYQTLWFYALAAVLLVSVIFGYVRMRTWKIRKRSAVLEQQVEERTREISSQRDELMVLNEELRSSQEEVMAQRDSLEAKNEEIARMNNNLERIVAERTQSLETQNAKLSEYAFINAHKLRAPLASILGIIHLLAITNEKEDQLKLLELLHKSSAELDEIVHSINRMLEEGFDKGN